MSTELEKLIIKKNLPMVVTSSRGVSNEELIRKELSQEISCEKFCSYCAGACSCLIQGTDEEKNPSTRGDSDENPAKSKVLKSFPELRKEVKRAVSKGKPSVPPLRLYPRVDEETERVEVERPPPEYPGIPGVDDVETSKDPGLVMGNPARMRMELERLGKPTS